MRRFGWLLALGLLSLGGGCSHKEETKADIKELGRDVGHATNDAWITSKLKSEYAFDADVKSRQIHVKTKDGVVTLTGLVDSPYMATRAVERALRTNGVKEVRSKLEIAGTRSARIFRPGEPVTF